jgi:hypothetical protein
MALTDALGVAFRAIGVAADVYNGRWDGKQYTDGAGAEADLVEWVEILRGAETVEAMMKSFSDAWVYFEQDQRKRKLIGEEKDRLKKMFEKQGG